MGKGRRNSRSKVWGISPTESAAEEIKKANLQLGTPRTKLIPFNYKRRTLIYWSGPKRSKPEGNGLINGLRGLGSTIRQYRELSRTLPRS